MQQRPQTGVSERAPTGVQTSPQDCPKTGVFQRTKAAVQQCSSSTVQVIISLILGKFSSNFLI